MVALSLSFKALALVRETSTGPLVLGRRAIAERNWLFAIQFLALDWLHQSRVVGRDGQRAACSELVRLASLLELALTPP